MEKERTQTRRFARSLLAVAAGALIVVTSLGAATYRPVVGEPFPDLKLPSLDDGAPLSVSAFRGKKIILHVFASW